MRLFYVIYIKGEVLGDCLDALRLVVQPGARHHAHLTVRGPYTKAINLKTINPHVQGLKIKIGEPGHFFGQNQHTVFFRCQAPALKKVWFKTDYPVFTPHITVYDGPSREIAEQLLGIMAQHRFEVMFTAGELEPLVSGQNYQQKLKYCPPHWNEQLIDEIVGESIQRDDLEYLTNRQRFHLLERLASVLADTARTVPAFGAFSWRDWERWQAADKLLREAEWENSSGGMDINKREKSIKLIFGNSHS